MDGCVCAAGRVREVAGHSLKSALRHVWTVGTEDDALVPQEGYHAQVTTELAGLGGNVQFTKHEVQARTATALPHGLVRTGERERACVRACVRAR
jgi:outer membrane protein insertion porin family